MAGAILVLMRSHLERAVAELEQEREGIEVELKALIDRRDYLDYLIQETRRFGEAKVQEVQPPKGRRGPSLRVAVVNVVRRYPNGVTPRQIADILIREGDPRVRANDPDPAKPVRTALKTAENSGEVYKHEDGTWRAAVQDSGALRAGGLSLPTGVGKSYLIERFRREERLE